ncbi:MAG: poly-gamma-glutamate hydrolase family protein [Desulfobacterales bacterium]|nr:poly-gamma-glutamate hydrolase family protein [Desulfobacterales bacterium]
MDKYKNYEDLKQHETEGEDYVVIFRENNSPIAVIAPHGGGIEPGTFEISDWMAGGIHSFYAFKGIKKKGNAVLHITSNRFDEPQGVRIAKNADVVVSIHGYHKNDDIVYMGGKNQDLKLKIMHMLNKAGFHAEISTKPGLRGQHPENICNLCRTGEGVQLEISRGLRDRMFENLDRRSWRKKTVLFFKFVDTLREALR